MTTTEYYTGADCTGSSGDSNRVLTLTNTQLTISEDFQIYASGLLLSLTSEYTVSHNSTGTEVTFLEALWDDMELIAIYNEIKSSRNDFERGPLADLGVTISRTPVTEVESNIGGQKKYTDGTTQNITGVFENITKGYYVDKAGETIRADARLSISRDQDLNKHDKVEYNGQTYRVNAISPRIFQGSTLFKTALLFLVT